MLSSIDSNEEDEPRVAHDLIEHSSNKQETEEESKVMAIPALHGLTYFAPHLRMKDIK